jgi:PDDEXK-like domain of unknown function (DUF3799)
MSWHGIRQGIDFSEYRSDDINQRDTIDTVKGKAISKSLICDFIADPSAWKNSPAKVQTEAMKGGSLLDCLLTTPHEFDERYAVSIYDEFRTKESKAWRDEMEASGKTVIKIDQLDAANDQLKAIRSKPEAAKLLEGAQFQVAFRHDTAYPFSSKGLIDILPDDNETIVDLKRCEPGALESKRSLARYIFDWGYHIQAGAYCEGMAIASGIERTQFKFIFITSKPPFRVAVVSLPFPAISYGADLYRNGAKRFAECLTSNKWPSIWDGEVEIDLPEYAYGE